ncbi:EAL domain-containing protein [Stakelama tenebrarum]|uniref:EAL domain-containing protein n=1 Tax=Stakelama tenebrarum TaxID=2711215 RepID=A0A6G6Y2Q3_9SPHN|nr:EAL domain-containing protein [Sphingosinithalassobacter tenebrarum]QIG78998.1 EAL domain-containing protein [Sphingosinithalassobacter tenebrarum]
MYAYSTSRPDTDRACFAFQPIVDAETAQPAAHRLVLRCPAGGNAITEAHVAEAAVNAAAAAGLAGAEAPLLLPLAGRGDTPEKLLHAVFRAALVHQLPSDALIVAIDTGDEGAAQLVAGCERRGIAVALEGFAAAPEAIRLLARVTPRFVLLDPALVRRIETSGARRGILDGVVRLAARIGVSVVAPGIQTPAELAALHAAGIRHVAGDWIAPASARFAQPLLCDEPAFGLGRAVTPRRANAALVRREIGAAHRRLQHHHRAAGHAVPAAEPLRMPLPA